MSAPESTYEGWAILELMGHRRLAGYLTEVTLAGQGMLRLDIPEHPFVDGCTCGSATPAAMEPDAHKHNCYAWRAPGEDKPVDVTATQFYSPSALYCLTPTTEEIARALAVRSKPEPVQRWELPERVAAARDPQDEDEIEIDEQEDRGEPW